MSSIYDFTATLNDGSQGRMRDYQGLVMLIVNTASQCGFTPQYAGLETLYDDYGDRGLQVLGFPCNQFGAQEPGNADEIRTFCTLTYDVHFPIFAKVDVNGRAAHPLFRFLTNEKRGLLATRRIKWNFTKFLVDRSGQVVSRFSPTVKPEALRTQIEALL